MFSKFNGLTDFFQNVEFGAVQKCANLVDLENAVKRMFTRKICFRYSRERASQTFAKNCKVLEE